MARPEGYAKWISPPCRSTNVAKRGWLEVASTSGASATSTELLRSTVETIPAEAGGVLAPVGEFCGSINFKVFGASGIPLTGLDIVVVVRTAFVSLSVF